MENRYEFVIDTDSYAGNFERELCAYITGVWDGNTHGKDQSDVFDKEMSGLDLFEDVIYSINADGEEWSAPQCLKIEPSSGEYNSVGIYFNRKPTSKMIEIMKERSHKFSREGLIFNRPVKLKILGFRLLKRTVTYDTVASWVTEGDYEKDR